VLFFRRSIFIKLLSWFFLNLIFLGLILILFFQIQFYVPPDSFLRLHAEKETASLRHLIRHELTRMPRSQWDELLARYGQAFAVELSLFTPDGYKLAGSFEELPPRVLIKMKSWSRKWGVYPLRGWRKGRGGRQGQAKQDSRLDSEAPPRLPGRRFFRERSWNPTRYWLGVPVPILNKEGSGFVPAILLAATDSLFASALYPSPLPWIAAALLIVFFSLLWWWPMVRHITRPLREMNRVTEEIAQGCLKVQLDEKRVDEIGCLGRSINHMAMRLDGFITGQKRFLSDVAHELCAPLARLRMGLAVMEKSINDEQQEGFADVEGEAEKIAELVDEVLAFSRAELRPEAVTLTSIPVTEIVNRIMVREKWAEDCFKLVLEPDLVVKANAELLLRALVNLLRNALRYGESETMVEISSSQQGTVVVLEVRDYGPGVSEPELERIFEPFYRLESDRNRRTGGSGLGLAIVKTCIEACHGKVRARNVAPSGLSVTVELPAA
ncbi:MAG: HAMP domain-containing histidine kinase, partial [Deltaproteobacteria bacterium]|nr:HAMP domain-containing histidine kinase [Candidatus Tharpella aukensis]